MHLWGKNYKNRDLFMTSMVFTAFLYFAILFYVLFKTSNTKRNTMLISNITVIQVVIISISMLWLPLTIMYIKSKTKKMFLKLIVPWRQLGGLQAEENADFRT